MPRATILVEARPGSGPRIVGAVSHDARIRRGFATLGRYEAVFDVMADDQRGLLEAIALINEQPDQLASVTLLDMQVEAAPRLKAAFEEAAQ